MCAMTDLQHDLTVEEEILDVLPPKRIRFPAVEWNQQRYDSLTLREPTVEDLLEARKVADPFDQAVKLIQRVSNTPAQVMLKLPQRVLERASDYFAPFTPPSPDTAGGN
jgi:hypothetical protein